MTTASRWHTRLMQMKTQAPKSLYCWQMGYEFFFFNEKQILCILSLGDIWEWHLGMAQWKHWPVTP